MPIDSLPQARRPAKWDGSKQLRRFLTQPKLIRQTPRMISVLFLQCLKAKWAESITGLGGNVSLDSNQEVDD